MPTLVLTFSAADATRLQSALADTPYPKPAAVLKALLVDYLQSRVREFEGAAAKRAALSTLTEPTALTVS